MRGCKLTGLMPAMQDSLGGNAKTVIIANVSPVAGCARETQSTLAFAQRAKQIVNKAKVNEDTHGEAALLTRENERLRRELQLLSDTYQALRQVCCCSHMTLFPDSDTQALFEGVANSIHQVRSSLGYQASSCFIHTPVPSISHCWHAHILENALGLYGQAWTCI